MPGPALHERSVQAAVKTVKTNCVCSGAHCAAVGGFAALRMRRPLYGERAPCTEIFNRGSALVHRRILLMCHCEAPKGPWQSREGSYDFAAAFLSSSRVLRDSHVASLLGMTRQAGAAVHQSACVVECSPTGRSGNAATLACAVGDRATKPAACKAVTDRRYRRNWRVPF